MRISTTVLAVALLLTLTFCATESHQALPIEPPPWAPYSGPRQSIALGQFHNSSPYMRGMFSEGPDRLGNQAKTILQTHLSRCGRFQVLDRRNLEQLSSESDLAGVEQELKGARYVLTGEVTEFGRKTTGGRALFGILGRGKTQLAYSKVSLNVVDVQTSEVVYSVQGAGEYQLSEKEVLGTGGTSGYDSTLNGKVLDFSIREAVGNLVQGIEYGEWDPSGTS